MTGQDGASVDYGELCQQLENQELEAPGGIASPLVYGQLLAIYLLENDLTNAKFLWKRIPQPVKTANPDLAHIWAVGQKLWLRDYPGVYESLKKDWGDSVQPIMTALSDSLRTRAFNLVGQAYSSITGDDCAAFVGLPVNEVGEAAVNLGWTADAQTRMITPKRPKKPDDHRITNEQQLERLTDYVSFLEN